MSAQLEQFRDHCKRMSTAAHKLDCPSLLSAWLKPTKCAGCVSADDRAMFARLGGEIDQYLSGELEERTPSDDDVMLWEDA